MPLNISGYEQVSQLSYYAVPPAYRFKLSKGTHHSRMNMFFSGVSEFHMDLFSFLPQTIDEAEVSRIVSPKVTTCI